MRWSWCGHQGAHRQLPVGQAKKALKRLVSEEHAAGSSLPERAFRAACRQNIREFIRQPPDYHAGHIDSAAERCEHSPMRGYRRMAIGGSPGVLAHLPSAFAAATDASETASSSFTHQAELGCRWPYSDILITLVLRNGSPHARGITATFSPDASDASFRNSWCLGTSP